MFKDGDLSEAGKLGLVAAVKKVRYGTATNLHGGLEEGVRLLRGDGKEGGGGGGGPGGKTIKRVFLFSDGVVNEGITDPSEVRTSYINNDYRSINNDYHSINNDCRTV